MNKSLRTGLTLRSAAAAAVIAVMEMQSVVHAAAAESAVDSEPGNASLDEVVVTALKRTDTAQRTPAVINVVAGRAIEDAGIISVVDLPKIAPGLVIATSSNNQAVATIHGIGAGPSNASFDPSVAMFVDGMYDGHGRSYLSSLFDIDSVQVVKGTQSALLGKNTSVGAIVLTSRKPTDTFGYNLTANNEFELGSSSANGAVNIPLSPTFMVRAAGEVSRDRGWVRNALSGGHEPATDITAFRISARWQPNDRIDWQLSGQRGDYNQVGSPFFLQGNVTTFQASTNAYAPGVYTIVPRYNVTYSTPRPPDLIPPGADLFQEPWRSINTNERLVSMLSIDLGGGYTFLANSGFYHLRGRTQNGGDVFPESRFFAFNKENDRVFSQELSVSSPESSRLSWIAGGAYYNDSWRFDSGFDVLGPFATLPNNFSGDLTTLFHQKDTSIAGFGQVSYEIIDGLKISGSGRYSSERKIANWGRTQLAWPAVPGYGSGLYAQFPSFAPFSLNHSAPAWDGSANLSYSLNDRSLVYVSAAKGTKSFAYAAAPGNPRALTADGSYAAFFAPEVARTYELGSKLGAGSLGYVDASVFYTRVENYQRSVFTSGGVFFTGSTPLRAKGFELSSLLHLLPELDLSTTATYSHTYNPIAPGRPQVIDIQQQPRAPLWLGGADLIYRHAVKDYEVSIDSGLEFRSRMLLTDFSTSVLPPSPSYVKLNLRVAIADAHGLEVAVVGRNLTDRKVSTAGSALFPSQGTTATTAAYALASDPPRTIALQFSIHR
jgi:iron complex outermembrane recepter protein